MVFQITFEEIFDVDAVETATQHNEDTDKRNAVLEETIGKNDTVSKAILWAEH